jgi:hypothetical protein
VAARGWLEHEIRSLPGVLACSITEEDVVVLVQPDADPAVVERAVSAALHRAGLWRPVRVFGGTRPALPEPVRIRAGRAAVLGTVSGAALLAAGVWLAGAGTGARGPAPRPPTAEVVAPPLARPLVRERVRVPVVLSEVVAPAPPAPEAPPAPPEGLPPEPVLRPLRRPLLRPVAGPPAPGLPEVPHLPVPPPVPEVPHVPEHPHVPEAPEAPEEPERPHHPEEPEECKAPPDRGAPRERHGRHRGHGPVPWSHSVLVPPHCDHGRPH